MFVLLLRSPNEDLRCILLVCALLEELLLTGAHSAETIMHVIYLQRPYLYIIRYIIIIIIII